MSAIRAGILGVLAGAGLALAGCAAPSPQNCQRYDAISLNRENGFAARLDWKNGRQVDLGVERMEVALTVIRPVRGPIELVHLVGDTEADHWNLTVPYTSNVPTALCSIAPAGSTPTCGAVLQNLPFSPAGHYYLRANDNTVLEAGISFLLCD